MSNGLIARRAKFSACLYVWLLNWLFLIAWTLFARCFPMSPRGAPDLKDTWLRGRTPPMRCAASSSATNWLSVTLCFFSHSAFNLLVCSFIFYLSCGLSRLKVLFFSSYNIMKMFEDVWAIWVGNSMSNCDLTSHYRSRVLNWMALILLSFCVPLVY